MCGLINELRETAEYLNLGKVVKEKEFNFRREFPLSENCEIDIGEILKNQLDYEHTDYGWLIGLQEHFFKELDSSRINSKYYNDKLYGSIDEINENLKFKCNGTYYGI